MPSSSRESPAIALDASFVLAVLVDGPASAVCAERMEGWAKEDRRLVGPDLWIVETVSALRKLSFHDIVTRSQVTRAVDSLFTLAVDSVSVSPELCQRALDWSERLGQAKIYDALYLAVAEAHEAELWTLDDRLARRAHQIGADWVHSPSG